MSFRWSPLFLLLLSAAPPAPPVPELQLPFECGRTFQVSQAHGIGSHFQNDTWAWDFRMPEGVPILAAKDGIVRLARGDSADGGCDPSFARLANYVVVEHDHGLETQYLHLSAVTVRQGDVVRAGTVLGLSGSTGWACGSHLHFKLARTTTRSWNNPSVPADLRGYGDPERGAELTSPACESLTH